MTSWIFLVFLGVVISQPEEDFTEVDTLVSTVELSSTEDPAQSSSVLTVNLLGYDKNLVSCGCLINGVDVSDSLVNEHNKYTLNYTVKAGDAAWAPGELPISLCLSQDATYQMVTAFTDGNQIEGDVHDPTSQDYVPMSPKLVGGFLFSLACSYGLGYLLQKLNLPLPLVTAYLVGGILSGPAFLAFIAEDEIRSLRFFDELCLAFIALSAGSKMHVASLKDRLKPIGYVSVSLVVFEYGLAVAVILALAPYVDFMEGMTHKQELAVATLAGTLVLARSPASAIAIIREIGAKGPFTSLCLGVTIVMDLVVIELFSITMLAVRLGLDEEAETGWRSAVLPCFTLVASIFGGVLVALTIRMLLWKNEKESLSVQYCQGVLVLLVGFLTILAGHFLEEYLDPLLACMVAGFGIVNYTSKREQLQQVEEDWSETIYLVLFTLTGAALAFEALGGTLLISLAIFAARIIGIGLGSFVGGTLVGEPSFQNRVAWMGYITQAGVTLGLAKKVHLEYSSWGPQFATTIVAVVVLNQMLGPPCLKLVIRMVKEDSKSRDHSTVWLVGESHLFSRLPGLIREQRSAFDRGTKHFEVRCISSHTLLISNEGEKDSLKGPLQSVDYAAVNSVFSEVSTSDTVVLLVDEEQGHALVKHFRDPSGGQFPPTTRVVITIQSHRAMQAMYEVGAIPVVSRQTIPSDDVGLAAFVDIVVALLETKNNKEQVADLISSPKTVDADDHDHNQQTLAVPSYPSNPSNPSKPSKPSIPSNLDPGQGDDWFNISNITS